MARAGSRWTPKPEALAGAPTSAGARRRTANPLPPPGPPRRSLSTQLSLLLLGVTLLLMASLAYYIQHEGSVARTVFEDAERIRDYQSLSRDGRMRQILSAELQEVVSSVERALQGVLAREVGGPLGSKGLSEQERLKLRFAIWELPIWRQEQFRRHVDQAVVVHYDLRLGSYEAYNPPRSLILEPDNTGPEMGEIIRASLDREDVVLRGGTRLAGPLRLPMEADWGGYLLVLRDIQGPRGTVGDYDQGRSLILVTLLMIPGIVCLFLVSWRLLSRQVVEPIDELGRVATAVAQGDYSPRVDVTQGADEVVRVQQAFNRMLGLVEEYHGELESKIHDATQEIERKNQELMLGQRLAATGTLAAGIAHEINNPLGGMLNVLRRLERKDISEEKRKQYFELLEEGIERIGGIVRKVLDVSPRKTVPQLLDLRVAIERALELVRHRANQSGVRLSAEFPPEPLPSILGESNEVGQIFLNLLINAVDACAQKKGAVAVRAQVVSRDDSQFVRVDIEDTGEGMEPEVVARAFDMFFTTKEAGKGTGLGLATVHSLVVSHGGTLRLRSKPSVGTRARVELPAYLADVKGSRHV